MSTPICEDCKHYRPTYGADPDYAQCTAPQNISTSSALALVARSAPRKVIYNFCVAARGNERGGAGEPSCGSEGKWFQPKDDNNADH